VGVWLRDSFLPYLTNKFVLDAMLRMFLEGYFEVCVAVLPSVVQVRISFIKSYQLNYSNARYTACSILTLIHLAFIIVGFPLFIATFLLCRKQHLGDPSCL
jgi:hypothetical protein